MSDLIIIAMFGLKSIYGKEPIFLVYNKGNSSALASFDSEFSAQKFCISLNDLFIRKNYFILKHNAYPINFKNIKPYMMGFRKAVLIHDVSSNQISLEKINSKETNSQTIEQYMQSKIEKDQILESLNKKAHNIKNEFKR